MKVNYELGLMFIKDVTNLILIYDLYTGDLLYGVNPESKHRLKSSKSGMSYYRKYWFTDINRCSVESGYEPMEIGWML
jgi:hypothetical protein